ncbi:hypothetical protein IWQ60_006042, partial [Tieghemiomyces parasiticus]
NFWTVKFEVEDAQWAVRQESKASGKLDRKYKRALQSLKEAQKTISTKNPVASQNNESELTKKLDELRQDVQRTQDAVAEQERRHRAAQDNLERSTDELKRAETEHAECLKLFTPLAAAFSQQITQLSIIFRSFSQAWLLNVALPLKNPSVVSKLNPFYADGQKADQHDEGILDDKRWGDLEVLRSDIQDYFKSELSMTTATLTATEPSEETSPGQSSPLPEKRPTRRVTPLDILKSPYLSIYKLITQFDDTHFGLLIGQVLRTQVAEYTLAQYTKDQNALLGTTDPRSLSLPSYFNDEAQYWARDLTVTLVTLRFLDEPTAIDPKSQLYKTLADYDLAKLSVRAHIWAIGTELGISDVDFLVTDVGEAEYSRIKSCASDRGWNIAKELEQANWA